MALFSRRGIEEDDLGEIKDFNVSHQSLDDNDPYLSLPAMLLRKNEFDSHVNSVTSFLTSKGAKIRSRYNQVPHLTQGTNGKITNSQLDTKNKSQEVSPFPAGDHKAHINRRAQRHSKHKTE